MDIKLISLKDKPKHHTNEANKLDAYSLGQFLAIIGSIQQSQAIFSLIILTSSKSYFCFVVKG
jgi:hypothetical protein